MTEYQRIGELSRRAYAPALAKTHSDFACRFSSLTQAPPTADGSEGTTLPVRPFGGGTLLE
jgi:hypothetical protein